MGEWIAHDGGKCPVAGNTIVQTRLQLFPKLIGDPVFADACSGWLHQPGEGLYISHYRIVGPQQEQAHMMAAPANLSGQGMLDNSIIAERDALRAEVERLRVQLAGCDVASRANTRQSLDEAKSLEPYSYGWSPAYESVLEAMAREIALREDNERLRKGRDERVREATDRGDQMVGPPVRSGDRISRCLVAQPETLDPRLGMPQPEGEPVGPRPMRRWAPIL